MKTNVDDLTEAYVPAWKDEDEDFSRCWILQYFQDRVGNEVGDYEISVLLLLPDGGLTTMPGDMVKLRLTDKEASE